MNQHRVRSPNATEAVKMRQRGLLCWMVHRSLVKLDLKASLDGQLNTSSTRKLELLYGVNEYLTASLPEHFFLSLALSSTHSMCSPGFLKTNLFLLMGLSIVLHIYIHVLILAD